MPKARPLRNLEDIKAVPADQSVELELKDDELDIDEGDGGIEGKTETDSEKEARRVAAREYREKKKQDDEDKDKENESLKQQLEDMRKAADEQRKQILEAQRLQQDADRKFQEQARETTSYMTKADEAEYNAVLAALVSAETEAESAQRDHENALTNGDFKAASEAQRRLSRAEARAVQLEDGKQALEQRKNAAIDRAKREEANPTHRQNITVEDQINAAPLLSSQKDWLRAHPDAWTDQRKNLRLQGAHVEAEDQGLQPGTQQYFNYLEERLGYKKAVEDEDEDETPPSKSRRTIVSAPVSRDTPNSGSGKSRTKITLTPKQREAAAIAGIDEITYAKNMLKLDDLKQEGYYNE